MENLESSILNLVSSIDDINKKKEIRVGELKGLAKKAEELQACFSFAKQLMNELSREGTESVEKMHILKQELKEAKEIHQQQIIEYTEQIASLNDSVEKYKSQIEETTKENAELLKKTKTMGIELSNAIESSNLLRQELQKAYLTCTTYEEQIIRLNNQFSLESAEIENKGEFYERRMQDLEDRVEIMEEGMYDPEAYYCLERDKVLL